LPAEVRSASFASGPQPAGVHFRFRQMTSRPATRRHLVFACLMLAMFMAAIEATVVATAMPQIVARLGGFSVYAWVFSAFLLTQTATTVMFGKLADLYGRKPVMITGLVVFLIGSILAGFSWSMGSLIGFRLLQGLGAGAIQPTSMTIVSDLYDLDERRRTQSYMATVWGVSAVVGPLAGAFIVQHWRWSWVFWINVPLGILAIAGLTLFLHEHLEHHSRRIDWGGAGLFTLAASALLLAISPTSGGGILSHPLVFAVIAIVAGPAFLLWERRAPEPMMDVELWSQPTIASANAATLAAGLGLIGLTACLPIYIQAVLGRSPIISGLTLTAMAIGWPIAATVSARLFLPWWGMRTTLRGGAVLIVIGGAAFPFLGAGESGLWLSSAGAFLMGAGMGMMSYTAVLLLQASVEWNRRGAATASNVFARLLGNTLGAAVFGAILNLGLRLGGAKASSDKVRALMDSSSGAAAKAVDSGLRTALGGSLHWVFVAMFVLAVATLAAAWTMPKPEVAEPFRRQRAAQPSAAE
jgi:multidrug resistance protein